MNEGQLIIKYVKSEEMVHNLKRKVEELEAKLKNAEQQLLLYDVSQQRELLLAYEKSQYETTWWMSEAEATNRINYFLANNCG